MVLSILLIVLGALFSGFGLRTWSRRGLESELGTLEREAFVYDGQRPHPLLDVSAVLAIEMSESEQGVLEDWIDHEPVSILDEYLDLAVIEEGTLHHRCPEIRPRVDWALETTKTRFGLDYAQWDARFPDGLGALPNLGRLIFLCGWTSETAPGNAVEDAIRLGRLASRLYEEPSLIGLSQAIHLETAQHRLLRKLVATKALQPDYLDRLLASLPTADLEACFRRAMAVEALLVDSSLAALQSQAKERASEAPFLGRLGYTLRWAMYEHVGAGAYDRIQSHLEAYTDTYEGMRERLEYSPGSLDVLGKLRGLLGPWDWRFPGRGRWTEDHRRLARSLLRSLGAPSPTHAPCLALEAEGFLPGFELLSEEGGCRVHYEAGEEYLWPSRVRVVKNPTGDWWIPRAAAP